MGGAAKNALNKELVVIGAGVSGLTLAVKMQGMGWNVAVIDKARGSGGRLSSKRVRASKSEEYLSFDLGCSSFTARSVRFKEQLQVWIAEGYIEVVRHDNCKRYMPVPRSSSLTRSMADRVPLSFQTRVEKVERVNDRWHCYERFQSGELHLVAVSDYLVLAIPPMQVAGLLGKGHADRNVLEAIDVQAQWVAMLHVDENIDLSSRSDANDKSPIASIHCETLKPGRKRTGGKHTWMVHMSPEWSQRYINADSQDVVRLIEKLVEDNVERELNLETSFCHRWLYSQVSRPLQVPNGVMMLGESIYACGDWVVDQACDESLLMGGVERAYLSAQNLSQELSNELPRINTQSA